MANEKPAVKSGLSAGTGNGLVPPGRERINKWMMFFDGFVAEEK